LEFDRGAAIRAQRSIISLINHASSRIETGHRAAAGGSAERRVSIAGYQYLSAQHLGNASNTGAQAANIGVAINKFRHISKSSQK
jgi:hypothetical protein